MSGGAIAAITAANAGTTAAAATKRRQMMLEEEKMTGYNKDALEGWEFKIVRAHTARFKKSEVLREVCEQEARAGWEMIEKFDNYRVRFKRRIEKRTNDQYLDIDPYRTQIKSVSGKTVGVILGLLVFAIGLALFWGLKVLEFGN